MRPSSLLTKARAAGLRALAFGRGCGAVLAVGLALLCAPPATAETLTEEAAPTTTLHVPLDKSEPLTVTGDVERIVVAQPELAKVSVAGPHSLYVQGLDLGSTNLLVYGRGSRLLQVINVNVGYDAAQLQADLRAELPNETIKVEALSGGLLLRGQVSNPQAAATAEALAEYAAPGAVTSLLDVRPDQVMLEVQLVETSEEGLRDVGAILNANGKHLNFRTGSGPIGVEPANIAAHASTDIAGLDLNLALRALENKGETRILAKPRLLALSGEKASFRAGGEFPYPVPDGDGRVTIEFRPYGTAMTIRPTVQTNGFIRVDLNSEVSSLDPRNSLKLGGVTVPALSVRRAATSLELRDGESFLFAGLYQDSHEEQGQGAPGALEPPVIGKLFRASRVRDQRVQLAIIVTAHIVRGPNVDTTKDLDDVDAMLPAMAEPKPALDPQTVAATPPPKAKGLARLIQKSPFATAVATRVSGVVRTAATVSHRAWDLVENLSRRVVAAARPRAPPAQAALKDDAPPPLDS